MSVAGGHAGTPVFMPREQITSFKYVKPVSDVWSMGATIYNLLTGAFPYPFTKERDSIDVILNDDIVPIGQRDKTLPKNFCVVLDKGLEKKARDRYQMAAEMLAAVKKALP
jgi:serine/threonine protein kinase